MRTDKYGRYYWCVLVIPALSQSGEIYVNADRVETTTTGDVAFVTAREDGASFTNLLIPAGAWSAVYAASVLDGSPVAVEYWPEQVMR